MITANGLWVESFVVADKTLYKQSLTRNGGFWKPTGKRLPQGRFAGSNHEAQRYYWFHRRMTLTSHYDMPIMGSTCWLDDRRIRDGQK
jgi:hypothetical protein